jgi:hypothetical protein
MYVYCVYPAMSKKSENLSDLSKKDRKLVQINVMFTDNVRVYLHGSVIM